MDGDDLYGLPLERFVPERDALAKALRADGRRADAAAVAALRKPTVAAWAVNQLVRTQRRAVQDLWDAGDAVREAQGQLLAGRAERRALRDAIARERAAVDALTRTARGLLTSDGRELTPQVIDRVADTLHAAALDPDARTAVRDGRLGRELRHAGLGALDVAPAPPAGARRRAPARAHDAAQADDAARLERARKAEVAARRRAQRAARALEQARERRDRAARTLAEAEEALADARAEAEAAAGEHRRAQAELDAS